MSDRELLKLAAKAAGYAVEPYTWSAGTKFEHKGFRYNSEAECQSEYEWNPLENDGDALRLAVKLELSVHFNRDECCVTEGYTDILSHDEPHGDDRNAATRRAIVRAAAEIGRNVP